MAGADGVEAIAAIVPAAVAALAPGGSLALEVGAGQAGPVAELMLDLGFGQVEGAPGPAGHSARRRSAASVTADASRSSATAPAGPARRSSAASARAAWRCSRPTRSTGSPATRPSAAAIERIHALKGRDDGKPSAVMFFAPLAMRELLSTLGPRTREALGALLPGPVTLVVANPERRYPLACREDPERLGLRLIEGPLARRRLRDLPDQRQPQRRARADPLRGHRPGDPGGGRPGDRRRRARRRAVDGGGPHGARRSDGRWEVLREGALRRRAVAAPSRRLGLRARRLERARGPAAIASSSVGDDVDPDRLAVRELTRPGRPPAGLDPGGAPAARQGHGTTTRSPTP